MNEKLNRRYVSIQLLTSDVTSMWPITNKHIRAGNELKYSGAFKHKLMHDDKNNCRQVCAYHFGALKWAEVMYMCTFLVQPTVNSVGEIEKANHILQNKCGSFDHAHYTCTHLTFWTGEITRSHFRSTEIYKSEFMNNV